jgi:arylsulfatase A-like enzyme
MKYIIGSLILTILFSASPNKAKYRKQPNIIVVLLDDLGYDTAVLGDSITNIEGGARSIDMPTLRGKLTNEGLVLDNAFASPTCTPSRVQLMTGKYLYESHHQFGYLNWNARTLAQELLWNGYKTAIAGKWQLHGNNSFTSVSAYDEDYQITNFDNPKRLGYSQFLLHSINGNNNRYSFCDRYFFDNGLLACGQNDYGPDIVYDYFEDFIVANKDSNRPFFFDYRMNLPHDPFEPPPGTNAYPNDTVNNAMHLPDMLSYADSIIANIVSLIDSTSELHEGAGTVLLVLSDNGSSRGWINNNPGGDPMLMWGIFTKIIGVGEFNGGKSRSTYLGCHIPGFVYYVGPHKKYTNGSHYQAPFGLIDVYATVLDLAKLSHLKNEDGVSIADEILNYVDSVPDRETLFQYYNPHWPAQEQIRGGTNINSFVTDGDYWLDSYGRFYDIVDSMDWELIIPLDTLESQAQTDAYAKLDSALSLKPYAQEFNKPLIETIPN